MKLFKSLLVLFLLLTAVACQECDIQGKHSLQAGTGASVMFI